MPALQYDHVSIVLRYSPQIGVILGSVLHPTGNGARLQRLHKPSAWGYLLRLILGFVILPLSERKIKSLIWSAINDFHCCMEAILTSHYTVQRESKPQEEETINRFVQKIRNQNTSTSYQNIQQKQISDLQGKPVSTFPEQIPNKLW